MIKTERPVILVKEDFDLLTNYIRSTKQLKVPDRQNMQKLTEEIEKAKIVSKEKLPEGVVRINSKVKVKDKGSDRIMEFQLVLPEAADIRQNKISILAPIGTALIGFCKGQHVSWEVPAGKRNFIILDVENG